MATIDFIQFHGWAEEFKGEMSLVKICEMEGVDYPSYISWRFRNGLCERRGHQNPKPPASGMVELEVERIKVRHQACAGPSPKALRVGIEFENGLKFVRKGMDIDYFPLVLHSGLGRIGTPFDTVAGSLPNYSANHLFVLFFVARTTFIRFRSLSMAHNADYQRVYLVSLVIDFQYSLN